MISLKFNGLHFHFIFTFIFQVVNCQNDTDSYECYENDSLFEGDIVIPPSQRSAIARIRTWKNGVIPYVFEEGYMEDKIPLVEKGMQTYFNRTDGCIKFVKRTNQKDYLIVTGKSDQCSSGIGRNGGPQKINLASWCKMRGIIHELFHTVGFVHEQNRPDRDDYVIVLWDNLTELGKLALRKAEYPYNYTYGVPYDYESISHYNPIGYTKNGKATLITKVLHCIRKLKNLPISMEHLNMLIFGKNIMELPMDGGEVGEEVNSLIVKWLSVITETKEDGQNMEEHETSTESQDLKEHETPSKSQDKEEHDKSPKLQDKQEHETSPKSYQKEEYETSSRSQNKGEHESSPKSHEKEEHETSSKSQNKEEHDTSPKSQEKQEHETFPNSHEKEEHETSSKSQNKEKHDTSPKSQGNQEHDTSPKSHEKEEHEISSISQDKEEHDTSPKSHEKEENETPSKSLDKEEHGTSTKSHEKEEHEASLKSHEKKEHGASSKSKVHCLRPENDHEKTDNTKTFSSPADNKITEVSGSNIKTPSTSSDRKRSRDVKDEVESSKRSKRSKVSNEVKPSKEIKTSKRERLSTDHPKKLVESQNFYIIKSKHNFFTIFV